MIEVCVSLDASWLLSDQAFIQDPQASPQTKCKVILQNILKQFMKLLKLRLKMLIHSTKTNEAISMFRDSPIRV